MNRQILLLVVSIAAFSAIAASPAWAAPEWLLNGNVFGEAIPTKTTGEMEFIEGRNRIEITCGLVLDGTAGIGAAGTVTSVLTLTGVEVTSAAPLLCVNVTNCPEPEFYPKGLPWKTELIELLGNFLNSYFSALYTYSCKIFGGLFIIECTTPTEAEGGTSFGLENKAKGVVIGTLGIVKPLCNIANGENEILFINSSIITSSEGGLLSVS